MDLVTGAMGSLLPKLGELLKEEYNLKKRVKKDIKSLEKEMTSMRAALRKVAEVPPDQIDKQVKLWAHEVRELSYDMEDAIDGFLVRVEGSDQVGTNSDGFKGMLKKMDKLFKKGKVRHRIVDAIKDIKDQVQDVANRRDRYRVDGVFANLAATIDPRLFSLYQQQKELIGIDDAKNELKNRLTGYDDVSRQQLKVLSIFGFGGLGKTSLATAVYDEIKVEFDGKAFVPVGRNPDVIKVLKNIIFELDQQKYTSLNGGAWLDERQLITLIQGMLRNKRYVIIIDDIWDIQVWKTIKCALLDDNCGSRVITTTRILDVAQKAGDVYKLVTLSDDNSEKLFYSRLGHESKFPCDQEAVVSRNILRKCSGVPLAIITMASLLAGKPREHWSGVYKCIGFGHGDNAEVKNTRKILSFSYYDLPFHLRTCLLHLSIYPEDYVMNKDDVIWMWIAEGFIHEEQGIWSYDIGERYLNELINKSMIQATGSEDAFYAFRVHDMVLDMICSLSTEENSVTVLNNNKQHQSLQRTVRRLALQRSAVQKDVDPFVGINTLHVRSLYLISCHIGVIPTFSGYRVLRVLSMDSCTFEQGRSYHIGHLGRLIQLRYLRLGGMHIDELPGEIGALSFLQVLDLTDTGISELSHSVGLLRNLKCLRASRRSVQTPGWIGNLTSLEELSLHSITTKIAKEVGKLRHLRKLIIMCIEASDESSNKSFVTSLGTLKKIIDLFLCYDPELSSDASWEGYVPSQQLRSLYLAGVRFYRLPAWINSSILPNLCDLTIQMVFVEAQDVEVLGRFPELVYLNWDATKYVTMDIMADAFPKLRYLDTSVGLRFLPEAMAVLEDLTLTALMSEKNTTLDSCSSLENLPFLRKVSIYLNCHGVHATDVEQAEVAARHALNMCTNRPIVRLERLREHDMIHSN